MLTKENGQTMVEFALILALIALIALSGLVVLGNKVRFMWDSNRNSIIETIKSVLNI